jgi:SAM-dependent methyltransferase
MSTERCKVCDNTNDNRLYVAKEMMFGFRDEFEYIECSACGCLQLKTIPANIEKYYPDNYYSYASKGEDHMIQSSLPKKLKRLLKKQLLDFYLQGNGFIGKMLSGKFESYYPWIRKNMVKSNSAILDVGCGSGELLLRMYNDGFRNLTGVDPFIKEDIHYKCGITIHKKQLDELTGKYDLVMLHHAFEHMDEPAAVLKKINRLLNPGGMLLIRIPIADSFAWKKYGVNWVQLDAPRHFFLHTNKSMKILSQQSAFELSDVFYDSWSLQFYGSEKYLKDIPLRDEREIFSKEEMEKFEQEAHELNNKKQGDAACFYLRKN